MAVWVGPEAGLLPSRGPRAGRGHGQGQRWAWARVGPMASGVGLPEHDWAALHSVRVWIFLTCPRLVGPAVSGPTCQSGSGGGVTTAAPGHGSHRERPRDQVAAGVLGQPDRNRADGSTRQRPWAGWAPVRKGRRAAAACQVLGQGL